MSKTRDQTYLVNEQYKNADNLRARMELHERFSTFKGDFHRWVFEHIEAPENAKVLELGSGPAVLWKKNGERISQGWHITLSDLSPGMLEEAKAATQDLEAEFAYGVVDAQVIPFNDDTFDIIIANHMLYHVPDLNKTILEIRRVLKPGGTLYAATNGSEHMLELNEFTKELLEKHLPGVTLEFMGKLSFRLDNGAEALEKHFDSVEVETVPNNALEVTEVEPFINYILSMNRLQSQLGNVPTAKLDELVEVARQEAEKKLEQGPIHITKSTGLFIAS